MNTDMLEKVDTENNLEQPRMWKVFLLNDNLTPMDFVVQVLMEIFDKTDEESIELMLNIHQHDKGLCGIYPKDIAEHKVELTRFVSEAHQHPLRTEMEEE